MPRVSRRAPRPRVKGDAILVSVRGNRRMRRKAPRGRKARLFRAPRAGGAPLVIPLKCGYAGEVVGSGNSFVNFDLTNIPIGFPSMPAAWFTRYQPIFDYVRINKVKVEIFCPYNIGQHNVGTQSLYQVWSKKATTSAEAMPGSLTEWLNIQNAKRQTFSGRTNSLVYTFVPCYETTDQPLNVANTQLSRVYKQWQTIQTTPAAMTPHIGILAQVHRMDGSTLGNTNIFKFNVTMYCQLKSVKQL